MKPLASFSLIASIGLALAASSRAVTVDYTTVANGTYASVMLGGTTVTGSAAVTSADFGGFRGLGILGGGTAMNPGNSSLDPGETMTINLGGLSSSVVLTYIDIDPPGNVEFSIQAFNGASSLGTFSAPFAVEAPQDLDISSLIGGFSLSSFTIAVIAPQPLNFGLQIQKVVFAGAALPGVPESGNSLALLGLGLIALGSIRFWSDKKS